MTIETTTPPVVDEEFVALVLDHCKVEAGDEESAYADLVDTYIEAALSRIESASGRMLFARTMRLTVDALGSAIVLPASPVIATGIIVTYLDTAGDEQTLASDQWALIDRLERPRIIPAKGVTWPETWDFPGAVSVEFDAGYGATMADIPWQLRMAAMQTVADWMRFGGNVATTSTMELPASARTACMNFRRVWA